MSRDALLSACPYRLLKAYDSPAHKTEGKVHLSVGESVGGSHDFSCGETRLELRKKVREKGVILRGKKERESACQLKLFIPYFYFISTAAFAGGTGRNIKAAPVLPKATTPNWRPEETAIFTVKTRRRVSIFRYFSYAILFVLWGRFWHSFYTGAPLLSGHNMESQNAGYTGENGYEQQQDYSTSAENYQLQDQQHYDQGYAPPAPAATRTGGVGAAFVSMTSGSLFRSEEMALCQLFLQVSHVTLDTLLKQPFYVKFSIWQKVVAVLRSRNWYLTFFAGKYNLNLQNLYYQ